ncbi:MAG: D-arabinono-1,4-lactone oxidase [Myxococcota bacterium]
MRTIERGGRIYHLPASEEELCELVRRADDERRPIRVRGSAHSFPYGIYENGGEADAVHVLLDDYCAIEGYGEDPATGRTTVTVQAGCRLTKAPPAARNGVGPGDLSRPWWRWARKGLLPRLHDAGLALDDLGGISHQTVAGFVSTGSAGGSLQYSLDVVGLRIIDARGEVRTVTADGDPELFRAAGVCMGLLGIVSAVTFACTERFFIRGSEQINKVDEAPVDLFGKRSDVPGLAQFLEETEYTRLLWWPQPGVEKLTTWQARRLTQADFEAHPEKYGRPTAFRRRPYVEIGVRYFHFLRPNMPVIGWIRRKLHWLLSWPQQLVAGWIYTLLGIEHPRWYQRPCVALVRRFETQLINFFNQEEDPQEFWDTWWQGLPMDNQINDKLMPTWFTELWLPIEKAEEAMRVLRDMYANLSLREMGAFCVEIYAGAKAPFWLHPSGNRDTVRIDVFWFGKNQGDPRAFYQQFWDVLRPYAYRPHWGKYAPELEREELDALYPELPRFRELCTERDPNGIFRSPYWNRHLHLDGG